MKYYFVSAVILICFLIWGMRLLDSQERSADVARLSHETETQLKSLSPQLAVAMLAEDREEIEQIVQQIVKILGDQAGLPESPDEFRKPPQKVAPLTEAEIKVAYQPYREHLQKIRWWQPGLDPTQLNHALREVAEVIEGCLAANRAGVDDAEQLLEIAIGAGDFLIWVQNEAESGLLPFPAKRNGTGRPFEVAERMLRHFEANGQLQQVLKKGWVIEDLGDGGLQFDNGKAGVALVHLYEQSGEQRFLDAAVRAAEWTISRPVVPNWNYNSFSVELLAEVHRMTGDMQFLEAAKKKALLGVIPGQLKEGPRKGRWVDPHNARSPYHYIMVRGLAALLISMPADDADLPEIQNALQLALQARNPDFKKGVFNSDTAFDALTAVQQLHEKFTCQDTDCHNELAIQTIQRYAIETYRNKKYALGPKAWGLLLELAANQK